MRKKPSESEWPQEITQCASELQDIAGAFSQTGNQSMAERLITIANRMRKAKNSIQTPRRHQ